MRTLRKLARAALVLVGALLLNLYGALWTSTALAATTLAQVEQPRAPGFVFFLLFALIFVAVLAFSFMAYRDVNR